MAKSRTIKDSPLLGVHERKVQPKLRMIINGSREVNEIRSELCSAIRVAPDVTPKAPCLFDGSDPCRLLDGKMPKRQHLTSITKEIEANVFVALVGTGREDSSRSKKSLGKNTRRCGQLVSTTVTLEQLKVLVADQEVAYVELGEHLRPPSPQRLAQNTAPPVGLRRFTNSAHHGSGENAMIGIIDVEGFDFAHPDFLDSDGGTRFVSIWDQAGQSHAPRGGFDYGSEITQDQMNQALDAANAGGIIATELEPQSQMVPSSHGTHVASIAAGNRGVCRNAFIAGVLISLPREDMNRRKSFYDSTRLVDAVEYLYAVAEELRLQHGLTYLPISINVSLGTNGHAHDASSAVSRWMDSSLSMPGRSVSVAAGNAGQEAAQHDEDVGFVMGRIHTSGRVPARGLEADIHWNVVGDGIADLSENELEVWYSPSDRFAVSIKPPGQDWIGPVEPRAFIENRSLPDGSLFSIYNELYYPANGANYIAIYLSPFFSSSHVVGVKSGEWVVRLHGLDVRDGRFHGWIERDDPRRLGRIGPREAWRFPSFFATRSNVDNSSISSLACGQRVLAVANLDETQERINVSSSQGPTRDGRNKPDVAAPGTAIAAACGFDEANRWIAMTGTSMASPYVAGVAGLMLAIEPSLTAAQIGGIIQRTAQPLPGHDYAWRDDAGYGVIDPEACLREASWIHERENVT